MGIPLLSLLAALGISLGGFAPGQLNDIRVVVRDGDLIAGTAPDLKAPMQLAWAVACEKGHWEGTSCPNEPGRFIVIDTRATASRPNLFANDLAHEAYNLVTGGWDQGSAEFACKQFPIKECAGWLK